MATISTSGYLFFNGNISGSSLTPSNNWTHGATMNDIEDADGDGQPDTGDYWLNSNFPYTGFTVSINGNDYAVFSDGIGFAVPYFDSFEDISSLNSTVVTQAFTQSGDNASVVNMCFLTGTLIDTPSGARPVEDLRIGDLVRTTDGRAVAVKWLGHQLVKSVAVNVALAAHLTPVCIREGTLGTHADLYVSADHGMIVDGYVVNASALVNGDTIRFVPAAEMPASFTYWHIETDAHDAILANGAASETFMDAAGRAMFDNHAEYVDLYGVERIIPEMPSPRITTQRLLPDALKARLGIAIWSSKEALDWSISA